MDAIEKAIRNALEKGDAGNSKFRERVYSSAFSALERALGAKDSVTPEIAERRRQGLRAKILEIETEFVPADMSSETPVAPDVSPESIQSGGPDSTRLSADAAAPEISAIDRPIAQGEQAGSSEKALTEPRTRRPFAIMFVVVLFVAAVGTAFWWVQSSGLLESITERDGSVPNPAPELQGESFRPEKIPDDPNNQAEADIPRNWIGIFTPADSTGVTVPGGAKADLIERDGEPYLRVTAPAESEVLFDIGEGTLERIAGGRALFSIAARTQEGETAQISVACDLAELGDCGRKRYEVSSTLAEFLFEVELPNRQPGAAGTIAISPNVSGSGKLVDIREIRVAITQ